MKLYRFTVGVDEKIHPFENDKEAYDRRTEVDPTYHWTPVVIKEITVEGYEIIVRKAETEQTGMSRAEMRKWLQDREIKFYNGLSDEKLQELIQSHGG